MKDFLHILDVLNSINSPNIVRVFGFCSGDIDKHLPYLLLDFVGKNLEQCVSDISNDQLVSSILEICCAMNDAHLHKLIAQILKTSSILIDKNGHVKLDCLAFIKADSRSKSFSVSEIKFVAPEILNEESNYDEKVDVYSFGVLLFFMLTKGQLPKTSIREVVIGKMPEIPETINETSTILIKRCWSFNPAYRPSFNEIIEFIKQNNLKLID